MGGCASKPKDLDVNEVAPAPVEAPVVENVEPETVAQEINGGEETKTEEPLVDLSEPTEAANEMAESKPAEDVTVVAETNADDKVETEEKTEPEAEAEAENKTEAEAEAEAEAEVKTEVEAEVKTESEAESAAAEVSVASATESIPEPVAEVKTVEAQTSEDKNDAPLVTL
ncbi:unnamed protein product [Amaranthus hypochondriacus]